MPERQLENLGWGNGWPNGELPEIVKKCEEARLRGEKHDYHEEPGLWSCTHRVVCATCGYEYIYDSGG